jgi:hypothetical protein
MIDKAIDNQILKRLKRSAAGLPWSDGRPVSELDRLLAQGALIGHVAWPRGGMSLFALVNGLHTEALFNVTLSTTLGGMLPTAEASYFSTVMADIVSGRLIVREPINFLRCNGVSEIQSLAGAREGLESMAVLVRFMVKFSEAREWLLVYHEVEIPDWLDSMVRIADKGAGHKVKNEMPGQSAKWSDRLPASQLKLRRQFDAIQVEIAARGYPPLAIPQGGKTTIERACMAEQPEYFDKKSSFKNAWKELNGFGLVRFHNYEAHCGNPDGRQ